MKTTESPKIKSLLERELGFMKSVAHGSEQEFITAINTKVTKIQERLYGARLKGYFAKYNLGKDEFESKAITYARRADKAEPEVRRPSGAQQRRRRRSRLPEKKD